MLLNDMILACRNFFAAKIQNRNLNIKTFLAFSLIELMISLIIVSCITAAFAPVITKKLRASSTVAMSLGSLKTGRACAIEINEDCKVCKESKCYVCFKNCASNELKNTETCTCNPCPNNKICDGGTSAREPQEGYYSNHGVAKSCSSKISDCKTCTTSDFGNSVTCTKCISDTYLNSNQCTDCIQSKKYCPEGTTSSTVKSCSQQFGSRCGECNSKGCTKCTSGYFLASGNVCMVNHNGTYSCMYYSGPCGKCPKGYHCDGLKAAPCEKGTYQDLEGQTSCKNAPKGSYQEYTNRATYTSCEEGTYQDTEGQTSCKPCLSGYYQNETGKSSCKLCSSKTNNCSECNIASGVCTKCINNTIMSIGTSPSCSTCPDGGTCDGSSTLNCSVGYYKSSNSCTSCSSSTYSNMTACLACDSASKCTSCLAGYYLSSGRCYSCGTIANCATCSSSNSCKECVSGYYLTSGSCKACSESNVSGMEGCEKCTSSSYCTQCGTGYYKSGSKCYLCAKSSTANMLGCQTCSNNGTICYQCQQGYYLKSNKCYPCSEISGCKYCSSEGVCSDCKEGYKQYEKGCVKKIEGQSDCDKIANQIGISKTYLLYINGACATRCNIGDSPCGFKLSYSSGKCYSGIDTATEYASKASNLGEAFSYSSKQRIVCDKTAANEICANLNTIYSTPGYVWDLPSEDDLGSWANYTSVKGLHLCDASETVSQNSNQCTISTNCNGATSSQCATYCIYGKGITYGGFRNTWYTATDTDTNRAFSVRCVLR